MVNTFEGIFYSHSNAACYLNEKPLQKFSKDSKTNEAWHRDRCCFFLKITMLCFILHFPAIWGFGGASGEEGARAYNSLSLRSIYSFTPSRHSYHMSMYVYICAC